MNELKQFIINYRFPYTNDEISKLAKIFEVINDIIYEKISLDKLNVEYIDYLSEKNIITIPIHDLIITYINYVRYGHILNNDSKKALNKLLENVVFNLRRIDEEYKNCALCKRLMESDFLIDNLNDDEIKSLVEIIINSNIDELEKDKLLIAISLNINSFVK